MSMAGSMGGAPYEPLTNMQMAQAPDGFNAGQMDSPSMMQSQYPAGPAMSTFNGAPFVNPPAHGGMNAMETSGFTKGPGETGGHGGHGDSHDEHGGHGHEKIDDATGLAPRRCTDAQTCFCFLIYAILSLTLLMVAYQHGNTGRLTHGVDYYGRVCGVDPGVENAPFLFWCRTDLHPLPSVGVIGDPVDIDTERPTCVPFCPTSNNAVDAITCLRPAETSVQVIPGGQFGNIQTQMVRMQESLEKTVAYPTHPRGGRYCIPKNQVLADKLLSDNKALGPFSARRFLTMFGTLQHLWWLLLCAAVLSLIIGYVFIFCIKHCPYTLAKVFLWPLTLLMVLFTAWYLAAIGPLINGETGGFSDWYVPKNDLYKHWEFKTACGISIFVGCFTLTVAACFFGMAWNFKSIGITDLMNSAFETFRAVPMLYYVPVFEGVAKFIVFWQGISGLAIMCAEGWTEKNRIHVNGAKFAGLSREFVPATHDFRFYFMFGIWLFFVIWMLEFLTALGQFVTSYCTFKYFGIKKDKGKKPALPGGFAGPVVQGLKLALIYHPGSIFRGAIRTPMYRPVRILHWMTAELGEGSTSDTFLMKIVRCMPCCWCCGTIQECTKDCLQEGHLHHGEVQDVPCKDGFDDVVIRANDFDKGCEKAHELLEHNHKIVQYLYRDHSQTTINLIGVGSIAGVTACTVYLLVANLDMYKESTSNLYVADPFFVSFLTFMLSAYVAFGFMTLWDHTADTLLYCYAWARRWNRKTVNNYIPESLRYIVGFDDVEHDRYPYYGKAKTNMYLRTWLPMVGVDDPKKKKAAAEKKDETKKEGKEMQPQGSLGMGRRMPSAQDGSWMSGFGTGFGAWGRQQEAISGSYPPMQNVPETQPLMHS